MHPSRTTLNKEQCYITSALWWVTKSCAFLKNPLEVIYKGKKPFCPLLFLSEKAIPNKLQHDRQGHFRDHKEAM